MPSRQSKSLDPRRSANPRPVVRLAQVLRRPDSLWWLAAGCCWPSAVVGRVVRVEIPNAAPARNDTKLGIRAANYELRPAMPLRGLANVISSYPSSTIWLLLGLLT